MRIREARKAIGIKQCELARRVGVTSGAVSQWEKGLTLPGTEKLNRIAEALNTTVDYLLNDERVG